MRGQACSAEFMRRFERMVHAHEGKHKVGKSMTVSISSQYIPLKSILVYNRGKHQAVVMLRAYFDESGSLKDQQHTTVAIGGCVASIEQWEKFEEKWSLVLQEYRVSRLHMRHFAHFRGEFAGWDEEKRRSFLHILVEEILLKTVKKFVGACLPLQQWNELSEPQKANVVDPYFICFQDAIHKAGMVASALFEPQERVHIIFENHPEFSGRAIQAYSRCLEHLPVRGCLAPGPITFGNSVEILPLQAADFVAYELLQLGRRIKREDRYPDPLDTDMRWGMKQLLRGSTDFEFYTLRRLTDRVSPRPNNSSSGHDPLN